MSTPTHHARVSSPPALDVVRGSAVAGRRGVVVLSYFLLFLGAGVFMPYFPLYLYDLGYSGGEIGLLLGIQPALRWTSAIAWAYLADGRRIRQRLLVVLALVGTLCYAPLLTATRFSTVTLVCCAISLLHGPLIPLLDATVMDHLPGLGGDYGRLRVWGSISFGIGALGSALLVQAVSPAIVPLLLTLPALALPAVFDGLPRGQASHAERARPAWALLSRPLAAFLATAFLLQMSCGAWGGFFAVHTAALGLSPTVPGLSWGLAVAAEVGLFFWGRRLIEAIAPADLIVVVVVVTVVRWALTVVARDPVLVVALQLGHAVTFSAFHLASVLLIRRLVPLESSTGGQALYGGVAYGLGGTAGLALAGMLVDRVGTPALFGLDAVVALLALVPALRLRRAVPRLRRGADVAGERVAS